MTNEEFKALADKFEDKTITPAEKLELLKELNRTVDLIRQDIASAAE
ncbi:MAG: hypothetical protein JWM20_400 [Patescibacteria group bacterium]|nr:hypothetical protein [Patescibacteria group bacterium]